MRARMTRWLTLWLAAGALAALAATTARADDTLLERSNKKWTQNDICGKESFRKYPDYTAESAAKRDAYMRECLRKNRLPPRNDLAQPLKPGP